MQLRRQPEGRKSIIRTAYRYCFVIALVLILLTLIPLHQKMMGNVAQTSMEHEATDTLQGHCNAAVSRLKDKNINFMALDFDLTIIDEHTGGRWKGTSKELTEHIRPLFKALIESAMSHNIHVAVVTFSGQTRIISEVLKSTFPNASHDIPVRGGYDHVNGKQNHIALATEDIEKLTTNTNGTPATITGATTVLIDDDRRNIRIAQKNGFHAVHFDPDEPLDLLQTIMEL